VPNRTFLAAATAYAEFPFEDLPSLFISGDMLADASASARGVRAASVAAAVSERNAIISTAMRSDRSVP
jgi:hypothetical protein